MKQCLLSISPHLCFFILLVETNALRCLQSVVRGIKGNEDVFGVVSIQETDKQHINVQAKVMNLSDGRHGFHVHLYGDVASDNFGKSTGDYYIPDNANNNPGIHDILLHISNFGKIDSINGMAMYNQTFEYHHPNHPNIVHKFINSIIGRGIVIHANTEYFQSESLTSTSTADMKKNTGGRTAVGVIGISNDELIVSQDNPTEITEHIDSADINGPTALVCSIHGEGISGYGIVFRENDNVIMFGAKIQGLSPGPHGYHIHWYGEEYDFDDFTLDTSLSSSSSWSSSDSRDLDRAGDHYNPTGVQHGLPENDTSTNHLGDGGNIIANENGMATHLVPLVGVNSLKQLIGRSCIVHADADDGSQPSGNSGDRKAGGILGYANPDNENKLISNVY